MASKRHCPRRACEVKISHETKAQGVGHAPWLRQTNEGGTWMVASVVVVCTAAVAALVIRSVR